MVREINSGIRTEPYALNALVPRKARYQHFNAPSNPERSQLVRAPFTLVRSVKPMKLAISIIFDLAKMEPKELIVPEPTEIIGTPFSFTWNVLTQRDGSLRLGNEERVKMIWWEAIRKDFPAKIDEKRSAFVRRVELKVFLAAVLEKIGVREKEFRSFVEYWSALFKTDIDPEHAPNILIQLVEKQDLEKFLPKMKIKSKETYFDLQRFYFLFKPVPEQGSQGLDPEDYLESLIHSRFSLNAVIDLGGEVLLSDELKHSGGKSDSKEFIDYFIENHVKIPVRT